MTRQSHFHSLLFWATNWCLIALARRIRLLRTRSCKCALSAHVLGDGDFLGGPDAPFDLILALYVILRLDRSFGRVWVARGLPMAIAIDVVLVMYGFVSPPEV
jgi:hypothetical protein